MIFNQPERREGDFFFASTVKNIEEKFRIATNIHQHN
jgi:hypothetical protein